MTDCRRLGFDRSMASNGHQFNIDGVKRNVVQVVCRAKNQHISWLRVYRYRLYEVVKSLGRFLALALVFVSLNVRAVKTVIDPIFDFSTRDSESGHCWSASDPRREE